VRILAISDLRVQRLSDVEAVARAVRPELILYAGDDVARFGPGPNSWSRLALSVPHGLAGVIGNDCREDDCSAFQQPGCHDLHKEPYLLGDFAILGLQGAPAEEGESGIGFTLYSEDESRRHLERQLHAVGDRPTILVSHAPPHGVLDLAVRFGLKNAGAPAVLELIKQPSLKAVVCGHVHLQGGQQVRYGHCLVVNCASHDDSGSPLRYSVLEWNGREVSATTHVHDDRRDLGEIRGMERRHADALRSAGVETSGEVHALGVERLRNIVGGYAPRYWVFARAYVERRPVFRAAPPPIAPDALHLDVETSLDPADVWMIAFASAQGDVEQLYELKPGKQRALLTALDKRIRKLHPSQLLQWSAYDRNALEKAYRRYWKSLPPWLSRSRWVDAMWWSDRAYALPFRSRSIKDVSAYFGYQYRERGLDGMTVGSWYSQYLMSKTPFDVAKVLVYNRDDVHALRRAVHSIITLSKSEPPQQEARSSITPKQQSRPPVPQTLLTASQKKAVVARATKKYEASTRRLVRAGKLTPRSASLAVSQYRAAARRFYGLSTSDKSNKR
jgi:hypothetical protein